MDVREEAKVRPTGDPQLLCDFQASAVEMLLALGHVVDEQRVKRKFLTAQNTILGKEHSDTHGKFLTQN